MKKWIPFIILLLLAISCTIVTAFCGLFAYLALTGLDLLVTAKKTLPQETLILAVISLVLWFTSFGVLLIQKPYKKKV